MQRNTPSRNTAEQEPSGQGHRTRNITHQAGTPVNRSQEAKDTTRTAQTACRPVNGGQVAKDTAHTAHRPATPVDGSQVAKDTAHATQHTERAHR